MGFGTLYTKQKQQVQSVLWFRNSNVFVKYLVFAYTGAAGISVPLHEIQPFHGGPLRIGVLSTYLYCLYFMRCKILHCIYQ
jgi:hypothetical protein